VTRLRALFSNREFTLEPLDLNEVAREVIALWSNELHEQRIILRLDLADGLPVVAGDPCGGEGHRVVVSRDH